MRLTWEKEKDHLSQWSQSTLQCPFRDAGSVFSLHFNLMPRDQRQEAGGDCDMWGDNRCAAGNKRAHVRNCFFFAVLVFPLNNQTGCLAFSKKDFAFPFASFNSSWRTSSAFRHYDAALTASSSFPFEKIFHKKIPPKRDSRYFCCSSRALSILNTIACFDVP